MCGYDGNQVHTQYRTLLLYGESGLKTLLVFPQYHRFLIVKFCYGCDLLSLCSIIIINSNNILLLS